MASDALALQVFNRFANILEGPLRRSKIGLLAGRHGLQLGIQILLGHDDAAIAIEQGSQAIETKIVERAGNR